MSAHLARAEITPIASNDAMFSRLQTAVDDGRAVSAADEIFYAHETLESQVMFQGMDAQTAYDAAIEHYGILPYAVYHPDVVKQYPGEFNSGWRSYWGI